MLERAISRHGENAYLLANLARVYAALGDQERADALIWRALELDPNEATSLNWLIANLSTKGGQEAALAAYARAATHCRQLAAAVVAGARCAGARRPGSRDPAL